MYNILYLWRRPVDYKCMFGDNSKDFFWTTTTNDSVSEEKKKKFQKEQLGITLDLIGKIECKDGLECKLLQESINYVFKPWITRKCRIAIDMDNKEFIDIARHIYISEDDEYIVNELICRYKHPIESGTVYLVKCANNKIKIGKTGRSVESRFEELKEEERNQAIEILDKFHSNDTALDEARLHLQCSKYKANGNGKFTCLQDHGNSELFEYCEEVMEIWNKYKESI